MRRLLAVQGHKLKNPKIQLVQQLTAIPAATRVIITGTPIQNNFMEMHSLFDFTCKVFTMQGCEFSRQCMSGTNDHGCCFGSRY